MRAEEGVPGNEAKIGYLQMKAIMGNVCKYTETTYSVGTCESLYIVSEDFLWFSNHCNRLSLNICHSFIEPTSTYIPNFHVKSQTIVCTTFLPVSQWK